MDGVSTKICVACLVEKPLSDYYIYRPEQINHALWCTSCLSARWRLRTYESMCETCAEPSLLDSNKVCKKCNKEAGLYECRSCKHLLPLNFAFSGKHRQCKWCIKARKKSETQQSSN